MEATMQVTVRSTEIDGNGHVNNAKYLEYLEWARQEWNEIVDLHSLEADGIGFVTVNVNINYRKEAKVRDVLTINTTVEKVGRTSMVLSQKIYNAAGELVADVLTTRVAIHKISKSSTPIPDAFKSKLTISCS